MAAEPPPRLLGRLSVRARTTLVATAVIALALLVAALVLVFLLRRSLVSNIDDLADVHGADIAALAEEGNLPAVLAAPGDDGSLLQVVDADGSVIAASDGVPQDEVLADFGPHGSEPVARTLSDLPLGAPDAFRVTAFPAEVAGRRVTIYLATNLEPVTDAVATLQGALLVGSPLLLLVVAVLTWLLVGRALRPVEAIRAEVADITGGSLDRRVPVPPADDEIHRLASTMNDMLDRLEAAARRQRQFVADASHDLQTPLASVRAHLEVALAHPEAEDWRATAADVLAASGSMESLVRDLLFLARTEDGARLGPRVPVDLEDVVLTEVRAARPRVDDAVRVDSAQVSAAEVLGRKEDLARVVRNLLDNALRHGSERVALALSSTDGLVTLVVHDDGPGIPAADRDRAFARFGRLDEARSGETGGTGLGLAIAKEIVESHDGSLALEDADVGARFVVRLPAG